MESQIKSLQSAARRRVDGDQGFTLVELMVVVLVIAILLAIAIPTFLGARERSQDRAAQSNVRNALTAAKVAFSNDGDYKKAAHSDLTTIEPNLAYVTGSTASSAEDTVSVTVDGSCNYAYTQDNTKTNCERSGTWRSSPNNDCGTTLTHRTNSTECAAGVWTAYSLWAGAALSDSETCWLLRDNSEKSRGTQYTSHSAATSCTGNNARDSATGVEW